MKKISMLVDLIIHFPLVFLYIFSGLFPRKKNLWLFGCWEGKKFRGNSKFFFLYIVKNHPEIKAFWTTKSPEILNLLKENGLPVVHSYSIKGIWLNLWAKFFITSHGIRDVNKYLSFRGLLVNLSHATFPIKDMHGTSPKNLFKRWYGYLRYPYEIFIKPDIATTSSELTAKATFHHYRINPKKIFISDGNPKSDYILSKKFDDFRLNSEKSNILNLLPHNKKIILFLPTWRKDPRFNLFDFKFDLSLLNETLEKNNAALIFNFHPSMRESEIPDFKNFESIMKLKFVGDEMSSILKMTDMLITDYSSIFAEYLLTNKPICFACFDHQKYLEDTNLYIKDYHSLPGEKASNWNEVIETINNIFSKNIDSYSNQRLDYQKKIFPSMDGNSMKRIAKHLIELS